MSRPFVFRKVHYWGSVLVALPLAVMIPTGVLLMLKKNWSWVQPVEIPGSATIPAVSLEGILEAARSVPEAEIRGWEDVDRLDVRPGKGTVKVQGVHNRYEIQIDLATAEVLQVAWRRSDLLEQLHDGSWFHDRVKLGLFLPSGVVLFGLLATGVYLFFLPIGVRRKKRRAARKASSS